jgi:hypothetical protein
VLFDIVGLGGEADDQLRPFLAGLRQRGEDIRVFLERDGRRPGLILLDLRR